jgi:hypothetical protein
MKTWAQVSESPEFLALPASEQENAREQYFIDVVAPRAPRAELAAVRKQFDADTRIRKQDLPAGMAPSSVQGGRGMSPGMDPASMSVLDSAKLNSASAPRQQPMPQPAAEPAGLSPEWGGVDQPVAPRGSILEQPTRTDVPFIESSRYARQVDDAKQRARQQPGTMRAASRDQSLAFDVNEALPDSAVARGAAAGFASLGRVGIGAARIAADFTGADDAGRMLRGASGAASATEQGAMTGLAGNDKLVADVTSSIMNSAPSLAVGVLGGPALRALFAQSTLAEYNAGRDAGFDPGESLARAGIMGAAEAVGERFGLSEQIRLLKATTKGMPQNELAKVLGSMIDKEIPGEQLTTAMQVLADKIGPAALQPNATFADYLEAAGETLKVTIGQTAVMGGGPAAVSTARNVYRNADRAAQAPESAAAAAIEDASSAYATFFKPAPEAVAPTAARADTLKRFDELAAAFGLNPKAAAAVRQQAGDMLPDEAPGFLARVAQAMNRRGLFRRPVDDASVADLDKRLRAKPDESAPSKSGPTESFTMTGPDGVLYRSEFGPDNKVNWVPAEPTPREPENTNDQPDVPGTAAEPVRPADGGGDLTAGGELAVGPGADAPGDVVRAAAGTGERDRAPDAVADGGGPDAALTIPPSKFTPEQALARMERQAAEDGQRRADTPDFEDREATDILSPKGTAWASKGPAQKRLKELGDGYRLARVSTGWVVKSSGSRLSTETDTTGYKQPEQDAAAPASTPAAGVEPAAAPVAAAPPAPAPDAVAAPTSDMPAAKQQMREVTQRIEALNDEFRAMYRDNIAYFTGDGPSRKLTKGAPQELRDRWDAYKAAKKQAQADYDAASARMSAATPAPAPKAEAPAAAPVAQPAAPAPKPRQPNGSDSKKAEALFKPPQAADTFADGQRVTLNGTSYTVAKATKTAVTLQGEDGKKRLVQVSAPAYGKIKAEVDNQVDKAEAPATQPEVDAVPAAEPVAEAPPARKDRRTMQEKVEAPAKDGEVVASVGDPNAKGERKFYVTMVRGDRVARLAGPFDTKEEAEAMKPRAQEEANKADPRSAFDAFGVSAVTSKEHKPGRLNEQLGIAPASSPTPEKTTPPAEGGSSPLYASRPLTKASADAIRAWAASQGFKTTLPAEDLHVTVAYSREPMDGSAMKPAADTLTVTGGKRTVGPLGDEGAVVLKFTSPDMQARWKAYRDAGASWDYESYTPHVTITYDGKGVDLSKVEPYAGPIELGPERQEPLNVDKADDYKEAGEAPTSPSSAATDAQQAEPATITDVGEKIGGARKDTAIGSGTTSKRKSSDDRPAWARRFEVSQIVTPGGMVGEAKDAGRWVIRDSRNTDWMGQPKQVGGTYASKEEADAFVPIAAVALKHRAVPMRDGKYEIWRDITDRKRVKVVDRVFDSRDDAMRYMAENAVAIIETNTTFGEADMPLPPDRARSGPERRQGNVTGQDFKDTFGFRGVEFGNWNNQDERQGLMNDAWDGLMDLADVLGIPPKAIGLNGDLALAFGARGHGLQSARAHYELDRAVINLTKEKGAGSLAHEWFHALDHYFGRQDGKASAQWEVKADGTRTLKVQGEAGDDMVSSGFTRNRSGVRPEVRAAYEALLQTMTKKAETYVEDMAKVDRFTGSAKEDLAGQLDEMRRELAEQKDVRYYKRNNKPATAEQLAEFDIIAKAMVDGDMASLTTDWRMLKGDKGKAANRWTNDALERLSEINKAVRGRAGFDADQKGRLDRLRSYMERYSQRLKMLADAQAGTEKTKRVPTQFAMDAKELDQGRGGDYWTTPHEMAARAFQGYVEDKIAERGGTSRFLNYGPENAGILTPWGFKRPFPAGEERKAINAALDKLIGTLQTRTDDAGNVALFNIDSTASAPSATLKALSEVDDLFALPRLSGKTVSEIAFDLDPTIKVTSLPKDMGRERWRVTLPNGQFGDISIRKATAGRVFGFDLVDGEQVNVVTERPGDNPEDVEESTEDVWIDVSRMATGSGGNQVYAIAGALAHNTGRIFIGDPNGLSKVALRRRSEQMLSLALRYGTTRHLAPHPDQIRGDKDEGVPPLKWVYGDDEGNVQRLVALNVKAVENAFPDLAKIDFDAATGDFLNAISGARIDRSRLAGRAVERRKEEAGGGPLGRAAAAGRTVARAVVLKALSRPQGSGAEGRGQGRGQGRDGLLDRLGAAASGPARTGLTGLFDLSRIGARIAQMGYQPERAPTVQATKRVRSISERLESGKISEPEAAMAIRVLAGEMDRAASTKAANRLMAEKVRGADEARIKLLQARKRGDLDPEAVDFALWAIDQNPALVDTMGLSVKTPPRPGASGDYNPANEVVRLFKGSDNPYTAVHEILHHTERMMPADMQAAIRREWAAALAKAMKAATPEQREALQNIAGSLAGDKPAHEALVKAIQEGPLNYDQHYHLVNPSEFWAVNASRLLGYRFKAKDSVWQRIATWLQEMAQKLKGLLGLRSDAPVLKAIDALLESDGSRQSASMLANKDAVVAAGGVLESQEDGIIRVRPMMLPSGPGWVVAKRDPNVGEMHLGYYRTEPEAREAAERERTEVRKGYGGRQSNRWWTPTPRTTIQSTGDGRLDSVGRDAAVRETLAARANSIKSAEQAEGLEQIPDRVGWCFPCAAQASAAGLGDMVIGRATGISGDVWHAVVMRDGAVYDPTFGLWFEPGVYEESLGFAPHTTLAPAAVRDFIAKTGGMAPDARNLKLDPSNPSVAENLERKPNDGKEDRKAAAKALTAGSIRNLRLPAGYVLSDFLGKSQGRLSVWRKTVGTPYDLAQRNTQFKRVFDEIQDFLHDVSHYAAESADRAPRLLPKLDGIRDIVKGPVKAEDAKAIAAPIFEGTLSWARDETGAPVRIEELEARAEAMSAEDKAGDLLRRRLIDPRVLRMWQGLPLEQYEAAIDTRYRNEALRAGVVWSDAELRSMFNLTGERGADGKASGQIGLYDEFRAATDKSLDDLTISAMLRVAGDDVAGIREQVLEGADLNEAAETIRDRLLELAQEIPAEADLYRDRANAIVDMADRAEDLKARGYAPLSRFGTLTLDVVTPDGERQYFGLFETSRERNRMARRMRENFPDANIEMDTLSQEAFKQFAGVTPETLELFGDKIGMFGQDAKNPRADALFQEWLAKAKSNRSGLKRLIYRKGVPGFSEDVGRVLASFVYSNARQTSLNLHAGEAERSIEDIDSGELKDYAIRLNEYVKNPQEEAQALRGLLFVQFLGGSVASAMVNMTQPFMVTLPYLAQYGGAMKASARMAAASKDVGRRVFPKDPGLAKALREAEEDGIVSPQEVFHLQAQAAGKASLMSGDGTALGWTGAAVNNSISRLAFAWGRPFAWAEQFNRRLTFIAAYRTAVAEGINDPAKFAANAVDATQFVYNKGSRPEWARGAVGATLFTFKTYAVNMVELLVRSLGTKEGRRAAAVMLFMMALMAGIDGLPFMEDIEDVIDGFSQRVLDQNFSTKTWRNNLISDAFLKAAGMAGLSADSADAAARFVQKGLTGLPGAPIDVSGRLGMHNLIPGTGLLLKKAAYDRDVSDIGGPAASFAARAFQAGGQVLSGDVAKAALTVAPIAVQNVAKAAEMGKTGYYPDSKERMVVKTTLGDAVSKGVGFQPQRVKNVQDVTFEQQRRVALTRLVESEIADALAKAVVREDEKAKQAALERLQDWNRKNPETPIKITNAQITARAKAMSTEKTVRVLKAAPKELRQSLADAFSREPATQE